MKLSLDIKYGPGDVVVTKKGEIVRVDFIKIMSFGLIEIYGSTCGTLQNKKLKEEDVSFKLIREPCGTD